MNRRAVLAALPLVALAGCAGVDGAVETERDDADSTAADSGATDSDAPSDDDGADADATVESTDLVEVEPATDPDAPSVEFASEAVHIEGTVVGTTGCHGVEVADAAVDDAGTFGVVVATIDDAEPGQLCTQSLTDIGYELDATFAGGNPDAVRVVHDDARGRDTAATGSADE